MRIREAKVTDAGSIARVHIDTWRSAYAGIVPAAYLERLSYQARETSWVDILTAHQPSTGNWVAATDAGQVVGFAGSGPERDGNPTYRGELYAIYLFPAYQRRGVGRRLVAAVAQHLIQEGFPSMLVWVLQDNHPGCRFYASLGGEKVGQQSIAIGGVDLVEVSYGWKDISGLAAAHAP